MLKFGRRAAGMALLALAGCAQQGISGPGKTGTLGYDLARLRPAPRLRPPTIPLPVHLVVAQAGALQPDESILTELRSYPGLFRKISVLPAAPELRDFNREVDQRDPNELVALAAQLGGDWLFLVGGRVEADSSRTPLSLLDLTILGYYLVPTCRLRAEGSVMGALIAVPDRRLVSTADASILRTGWTPSVSRHKRTDLVSIDVRKDLLRSLGERMAREFAREAGSLVPPERKAPPPAAATPVKPSPPVATVYVVSDGFHMSLVLPYGEKDGKRRYVELGLGERNWMMDRGWTWVDGILSGILPNEGAAIVEIQDGVELARRTADGRKRVWKADMTEEEWGKMLVSLEGEMNLQEVLSGNGSPTCKVVKTVSGYHLFNTCQRFVLAPLERAGKKVDGFPKPTPIVERHLDQVFKRHTFEE